MGNSSPLGPFRKLVLTWCCETALGRAQKSRHPWLRCTRRERHQKGRCPRLPDLQHWTEGWDETASVKEQLELEDTGNMLPFCHIAVLQPWGWPCKMMERVLGENGPGQTHKKHLKPLWHFPVSYSCNTTDPGWSPLLFSAALASFPSASFPTPSDCTFFQSSDFTSCKLAQPLDLQAPKGVKKPLPAQSSLVQLDFVSPLELPKDVINKQVSLPLIQEGCFFKLKYDFIFVSNLFFSCMKLAWVWAPWTSPLHCSCQTFTLVTNLVLCSIQ